MKKPNLPGNDSSKVEQAIFWWNEVLRMLSGTKYKHTRETREALRDYLKGYSGSIDALCQEIVKKDKKAKVEEVRAWLYDTVLTAFLPGGVPGASQFEVFKAFLGKAPNASICPQCGNIFMNRNPGKSKKTYCSTTCQKQANQVPNDDRKRAWGKVRMAFLFAVEEKKFSPREAGNIVQERYRAEIEQFDIPVEKWVKGEGREKNG